MTERDAILGALSESTMERLQDGETIELLVDVNETDLFDQPRSMETLTLELRTKGVTDASRLDEAFPDVVGLTAEAAGGDV